MRILHALKKVMAAQCRKKLMVDQTKKEGPRGPSVKREKERGLPQLLAGTRVRPSRKVSFLLYSSMRMGIMSTFMSLKDKEDIGLSCYSCGRSLSVERGFFCE